MLRELTASLLFAPLLAPLLTPLVAQQADDLLSPHWRTRAAAARALAALPPHELDIEALLRVLAAEWPGQLPDAGMAVGLGHLQPKTREPRVLVTQAVSELLAPNSWQHHAAPRIEQADDTALPQHPRTLAAWLLVTRTTAGSRPDFAPVPGDDHTARVWLHLAAPNDDRLRDALRAPATGRHVAQALHELGRDDRLLDALTNGDAAARSHVLAVAGDRLLTHDDALAAAVAFALRTDDAPAIAHTLRLVARSGPRGDAAIAAAVTNDPLADDARAIARALAVWCHRSEPLADAHPAWELALAHVDHIDADVRHRAAFLLGKHPIPATQHEPAVARLLPLLDAAPDPTTRLLAIDALGHCGSAIDADRRDQFLAQVQQRRPRAITARLLGLLSQLGAAGEVAFEAKVHIAQSMPHPSTATWLALADEGAKATDVLEGLLARPATGIEPARVAERFARTAPDAVRAWLVGDDAGLRTLALPALRALEPESGVATAQLLALLTAKPTNRARGATSSDAVIDWLAARDDLGDGVELVYAHMATRDVLWIPDAWRTFATRHRLPAERLLTTLEPLLRRGLGHDLFASTDRPLVRQACVAWHARTTDEAERAWLAADLVQLGATSPDEVAVVLGELQLATPPERAPHAVLLTLANAPLRSQRVLDCLHDLLDDADDYRQHLALRAILGARGPR